MLDANETHHLTAELPSSAQERTTKPRAGSINARVHSFLERAGLASVREMTLYRDLRNKSRDFSDNMCPIGPVLLLVITAAMGQGMTLINAPQPSNKQCVTTRLASEGGL